MFKNLSTIWSYVSDMDRSVSFYKDVVGLEPEHLTPYWSSFKLGNGLLLGLHPTPKGGLGKPLSAPGAGWFLGFEVDDIAAFKRALETAGVAVGEDFHEVPGGVVLDVFDPDGNMLQPVERGCTAEQARSR